MNNDDYKKILSEFNKQFNELRKDLSLAIKELSDKIADQTAISISTSKDIESMTLLYDERIKEIKKDMDNIAEQARESEKKIMEQVNLRLEETKSSMTAKFWISVSSGTIVILFLILKEFVFKGK